MTINCWNSNIPVELSKGGTNATSMATSTGIVKYDGTRLVTSSTDLIDSSNRITNASQPSFIVSLANNILNVTGDGTAYTIIFDVEAVDRGNNFDITTGIFTAPVTGNYFFQFSCRVGGGTNITAGVLKIVTSNRTYTGYFTRPVDVTTAVANGVVSVIANMSASHTASFVVQTTDTGGKIDDVISSSAFSGQYRTWASGSLMC